MIINHNMNALTALNKLNNADKAKANAMQKLSSGMRINVSADDSAGSSISQKMKAQIRGLEQASRNTQDGISLIQTAEAGLGSIQNPNLIRMKELMLQALNGTLTQSDRGQIQNELDSVVASIDDIANNTEFNTTKVLSPPSKQTNPPATGKADIVFVLDDTGSMGPIQKTVKDNLESFVNSIKAQGVSDVRIGLVRYSNNTCEEFTFDGSNWTSDISSMTSKIDEILNNPLSGGTENLMGALTDVANKYDFRDNENGKSMKHIIYVTDENADDAGDKQDSTIQLLKDKGIQVHGVFDSSFGEGVSDLDSLVNDTGGKSIDIGKPNWGSDLSSIIGNHIGESGKPEQRDEMPKLHIQVGANSNEEFEIELFDARSVKLGIDNISVDPIDEAEKSLEKIENAMEIVSYQRSKFGAYQNSLEHTSNNVDNYGYNLTSAESRISDTDMAKEMINFSKSNIIEEAAQSMLAQANKMQDGILNLITKWQGNN